VRRALAVGVLALVAACGGGDDDAVPAATVVPGPTPTTAASPTTSAPTTTTLPPSTTTTTAPAWVVGANPLPLRPDGFGEVQPTPAVLVDRSLPTVDLLAPPASGAFESTVSPVDDGIRDRMGATYQDGCPVAVADLRYLTLSFRGFDGGAHTGELVVSAAEADHVVEVFRQLFDAGFPIEEMRLPTTADLEAPPTGDGNNTASFVCRAVRGGTRFSAHAYGLAIDVNPFQNPYIRDDLVLPELASAYVDRSNVRPGMILDGEVAVRAFEAIGWEWGGDWDDPIDYQHFSASGL
jgi:hypothetical protein